MSKYDPKTIILAIFFIFVLFVPAYWVALDKNEPVRSLIEYRTLVSFPAFPFANVKTASKRFLTGKPVEGWSILRKQFSPGDYQSQLEKALSDQFPLRSSAIQLAYGLDRLLIRLGYAFVDIPAIPADVKSGVFETRKTKVLFVRPKSFGAKQKEEIDAQITRYQNLIKSNPDINFYVFYIQLLDYSEHNPFSPGNPVADVGLSVDYFSNRLPEGLTLEIYPLNSFNDHMQYYFHTDHHWNVHGSLLGYEQVYNMLRVNYPDISPMVPHDTIYRFPDIKFHGSWARYALYPIKPADVFEVAVLDLPPYRILGADGQEIKYNKMAEYMAGDYSTKPFTDHYVEYYGAGDALHEYVFENGAERNLLVFGDSFSFAIEPLIASHYHHTYFVDLRNYNEEPFSLSQFLKTHKVDDIVVFGSNFNTINQTRWPINP